MYRILTTHNIGQKALDILSEVDFDCSFDHTEYDAMILKGRDITEMNFSEGVLAIARAGAHVSNVPVRECNEAGIVVFYTPGANANAVKELTLASLILSGRNVMPAAHWAQSPEASDPAAVEKQKLTYIGPEIDGKTLGVIGLGSVGSMVAESAIALGMNVIGYDPFIDVASAWSLSGGVARSTDLYDMASKCDYVTVHVPVNEDTKGLIGEKFFEYLKKGARLINLTGKDLVDTDALKKNLEDGTVSGYVTDFPTEELSGLDNVIQFPHIGSETPETDEKAGEMAARSLADYLLNGNIRNSVNFPDCVMPWRGKTRIAVVNFNIPSMISMITTIVAKEGVNIDNMINRSKGNIAYTLLDVDADGRKCFKLIDELSNLGGIVRVRLVKEGSR